MSPLFLTLPILMANASTLPPEPVDASFPESGVTWQLTEMNGDTFDKEATLTFAEDGRISGKAVCNTYSGPVTGTPDAFEIGAMISTKMACLNMEGEQQFLDALATMTSLEQTDTGLILRNADGSQMLFVPASE
ncbi:META domain-containing protein [Qingshengfaniella alkalisoli]|uniref:META domain-containing protein n=1 Tax=Qingshengfaniella alkalisoli TaxID=2599296 RepID=A0A5B8IUS0_9RHOB|nr:META domain-containing protein [Qingshengfaniella alkalisoli]QDY68198.1 META domain-containing protein [Qingshengfaniella alkalisoli]